MCILCQTMAFRQGSRLIRAVLCCAVVACAAPPALAETPLAIIALNEEAAIAEQVVRLSDLAEVHGASKSMADWLAAIDVSERPAPGESELITQQRIALRLMLAGIKRRNITFAGARATRVRAVEPGVRAGTLLTDGEVIEAVRQQFQNTLQLPAESVRARLMKPIPEILVEPKTTLAVTAHVTHEQKLGIIRPTIRVVMDGRLQHVFTVQVNVATIQDVLVAKVPILAGTMIEPEHVELGRRTVTSLPVPTLDDVVGHIARTKIPAGEVLATSLLRSNHRKQFTVRSRDIVRLVARKGSLQVAVSAGEVLQNGNVGDFVRVRNPSSNKVISGRVKNSREVEVVF